MGSSSGSQEPASDGSRIATALVKRGLVLREEQRRRQEQERRRHEADNDPEAHLAIPGDELNADNTVPVAPLMEDQPRQGLWVDIEI